MKHSFTQKQLVHEFFYKKHNEYCYSPNASFKGKVFNSYRTTVGYIYKNMLLISRDSMSSSYTSKTLGMLSMACPLNKVNVKFVRGENLMDKELTDENVLGICTANFAEMVHNEIKENKSYTRRIDRENAFYLLEDMKNFWNITGAQGMETVIENYQKFIDEKLESDVVKKSIEQVEHNKQVHKERLEQERKEFLEKVATTPFMELVQKYIINFCWDRDNRKEQRERQLFIETCGVMYPSFVWYDKEQNVVRTSQSITMGLDKVIPLLKLWKRGSNIVGLKCGDYTILTNNKDVVKIGCHNFPTKNIQCLYDLLVA